MAKITTLFEDSAKTEALYPRTKVSAVSDRNNKSLEEIIDDLTLTEGTGIDITNNVVSNPNVYNVGDTLSFSGTHCVGVLTGTRNLIRFFIPLNQPILASSISFSNLTISVRATVGTIIENVDVASTTGYSITVSRLQKSGIYIQVTLSSAASSATNSTPLDVQIDSSSAVLN